MSSASSPTDRPSLGPWPKRRSTCPDEPPQELKAELVPLFRMCRTTGEVPCLEGIGAPVEHLIRLVLRVEHNLIIAAAADGGVDHLILTNVDICPLPHFYLAVSRLLDYGFDALIINRRTVADCGTSADQLPLLWADPGRPHEGYDCFVFGAAAARRFLRNDAVVGAGGVMRGLIYNLVALARRLLILTDVPLTCHVGDDKEWGRPGLRDSIEHNWREAVAVLRPLAAAQPARFADFCANLPDRIRIERPVAGGPRLVRAPGFTGFLPPLDPEAIPESSADDPQR